MVILTSDGISHGAPQYDGRKRGSAYWLETTCGLGFNDWHYAGKHYGRRMDVTNPVLKAGGVVDCMTCLVRGTT